MNLSQADIIRHVTYASSIVLLFNLYESVPEIRGKKVPEFLTAMVPWTAVFVAIQAAIVAEIGCH